MEPVTKQATSRKSDETWLVPLPEQIPPVSLVRGALLVLSRDQLKAMRLFDAYAANLAPKPSAELTDLIAASWAPIALAHAHFAAIDLLNIETTVIEHHTGAVGSKLHGTLVSMVAQGARMSGVTPLAAVRVIGRMWSRMFVGGAAGVRLAGPKELILVISAQPLLAYRYHRIGVRMHVARAVQPFSARSYVREVNYDRAIDELCLRVQWV